MVAAALLWSCQTVRLGRYVASRQPLQLATQQVQFFSLVLLCCQVPHNTVHAWSVGQDSAWWGFWIAM